MEGRDVTVRETVNASKERFGQKDLSALFKDASKVIVAKGKKFQTFDMRKEPPAPADFAKAALGPTGNLRAPAIKMGKTWLIGFNAEVYGEKFD